MVTSVQQIMISFGLLSVFFGISYGLVCHTCSNCGPNSQYTNESTATLTECPNDNNNFCSKIEWQWTDYMVVRTCSINCTERGDMWSAVRVSCCDSYGCNSGINVEPALGLVAAVAILFQI